MSRELMIGLLRKGQNGNQILNILDAIVATDDLESIEIPTNEPTLEELEFWSYDADRH